ncbi:MAG: efflux RND transporter periplasmic adaptor subunit [Lachnospiraceae bacterium]|nr:efflux RND transporter periplasmic adaptor subunit [Lachnospiraceae bacterium]
MLRIKKVAPFCLAIAISLTGVMNASAITPSTRILSKEDLVLTAETGVNLCYTEYADIKYESDYSDASYVQTLVTKGTYVNEGDPIIEIYGNVDKADILEAELKLKRAREDYNDLADEKTENVRETQEFIDKMYGWGAEEQIKVGELRMEGVNIKYDALLAKQQAVIDDLVKTLKDMYKNRDTTYITAPISGEIASVEFLHRDDVLKDGQVLGTIYKAENALYQTNDSGNMFWYGMKVTLDDYHGNTYEGRVVSCKNPTLTSKITSDTAYIKIEGELPETLPLRLGATYETVSFKNVIVLSANEYHKDEYGSYVLEVTDRGNIRHYFTAGRTISGKTVALDGLYEGMEIITR